MASSVSMSSQWPRATLSMVGWAFGGASRLANQESRERITVYLGLLLTLQRAEFASAVKADKWNIGSQAVSKQIDFFRRSRSQRGPTARARENESRERFFARKGADRLG